MPAVVNGPSRAGYFCVCVLPVDRRLPDMLFIGDMASVAVRLCPVMLCSVCRRFRFETRELRFVSTVYFVSVQRLFCSFVVVFCTTTREILLKLLCDIS